MRKIFFFLWFCGLPSGLWAREEDLGRKAHDLFLQGEVQRALELTYAHCKVLCSPPNSSAPSTSQERAILFKNAMTLALAEKKLTLGQEIFELSGPCSLPLSSQKNLGIDLLLALSEKKDWENFQKVLGLLEEEIQDDPRLLILWADLLQHYQASEQTTQRDLLKKKIFKSFESFRKDQKEIPLKALDKVANLKLEDLQELKNRFQKIQLMPAPVSSLAQPQSQSKYFLGEKFKQDLRTKLALLDELTPKIADVIKVGSGQGIAKGYVWLIQIYSQLTSELKSISQVAQVEKDLDLFHKNMKNLVKPLEQKIKEYELAAKTQIEQNSILSVENLQIYSKEILPPEVHKVSSFEGILMDKGERP